MKTIHEIIIKEFEKWGYTCQKDIDGSLLYASTTGYDYWLICSNIDVLLVQKRFFDILSECSNDFEFIEKNLTLLLLLDVDSEFNALDSIKVENNKSYFKKFVLRYSSQAAEELIKLFEVNNANSIADLLLSEQCFNQMKRESLALNGVSLLYSIAHKLPFIPVNSKLKERSIVDMHFSSPELCELYDWIMHAPTGDNELNRYVNQLTEIQS